jgi:hypothetical protein
MRVISRTYFLIYSFEAYRSAEMPDSFLLLS